METDKKTILLSVIIASLFSLGINVTFPDDLFVDNVPKYFCETRPELGFKECDSFSKYVSELGKCIDDDGPNFICRSGWMLVIDDYTFPDEKDYTYETGIGDWICHTPPKNNCVKIE